MNDPVFVEKVAEEMWVARQEACKKQMYYSPLPWYEVEEVLKDIYRIMASRAIDLANQEIAYGTRVNIPVRINEQAEADTPLHHVLNRYGLSSNNEQ